MENRVRLDGYPVSRELMDKVPTLMEYPVRARRFRREETLFSYREPITRLSFLAEGRAKVCRVMENGRSVLHAMLDGVEVIGDLELLRGYPEATSDIVAITDGVLLEIPMEACREQLLSDAKMLRFLGGELAVKLERSSRLGSQNLLYPLPARLAAYVLFSAQEGVFHENLGQVSDMLATSYRHLLRVLKGFCAEGMLERCRAGYRIADLGRLSLKAEGILREEG